MTDSPPVARTRAEPWTEPRNYQDAMLMAQQAHKSGMFPVGSVHNAFMIIATGSELGISPLQALMGIHIVSGRPVISAKTLVGLCQRRRDVCEYFTTIESTEQSCTVETKRVGSPAPAQHTFTIEMAQKAGLTGKKNWRAHTGDMLWAAAARALARREYADLVGGMYDEAELLASPISQTPERPQMRIVSDPTPSPSPAALDAQRRADALTDAGQLWCERLVAAGAADDHEDARRLLWRRSREFAEGSAPTAEVIAAAGEAILLDHEQGSHIVDVEPDEQATPEQLGDGRADSPMTAAINVLMGTVGCTDLEAEQYLVTAQEQLDTDVVDAQVLDRAIALAQARAA